MILTRITAPSVLPVTLAQVTAHCRVSSADEDALLTSLIGAAAAHLDGPDGVLGKCLMTQVWRIEAEDWADPLRLPVEPVNSLVVRYVDADGVLTILDPAQYELRQTSCEPPLLYPVHGGAWPVLGAARYPVQVDATCGSDACPLDLQVAVLMLVAHWFEHREAVALGAAPTEVPLALAALLATRRRRLVV